MFGLNNNDKKEATEMEDTDNIEYPQNKFEIEMISENYYDSEDMWQEPSNVYETTIMKPWEQVYTDNIMNRTPVYSNR